jgi:hypothetical protein
VTEISDDATNEPLLTPGEVIELQCAIEAGLLARDVWTSGAGFADATEQELEVLQEQGEQARQRFIRANLGLVGMVSRQYAARSRLPGAELFQEGCVGLPLVNYLPVAPVHEPDCQLVDHVVLMQLDIVDTEPMDACNRSRRRVRVSGAGIH